MNVTWFTCRHEVILLTMKFQFVSWMPLILTSTLLQKHLLYLIIMSPHQKQPRTSEEGLILSFLLSVCYNLYYHWCGMNDRRMNGSFLIIKKRLKCWRKFGWMPQVLNVRYVEWESCLQYCLAENALHWTQALCVCAFLRRLVSKRFQQEAVFKAVNDMHSGKTCLQCHLPTERKTKWK